MLCFNWGLYQLSTKCASIWPWSCEYIAAYRVQTSIPCVWWIFAHHCIIMSWRSSVVSRVFEIEFRVVYGWVMCLTCPAWWHSFLGHVIHTDGPPMGKAWNSELPVQGCKIWHRLIWMLLRQWFVCWDISFIHTHPVQYLHAGSSVDVFCSTCRGCLGWVATLVWQSVFVSASAMIIYALNCGVQSLTGFRRHWWAGFAHVTS